MQTTRRTRLIVLVFLVAVAAVVAGCGLGANPAGPLVTVEMRGGECANGPCGTTVILERDGRVHQAAKPPNDLGTVPLDQVAALDAAIKLTDFAEMRKHPFTGECPTAFDGQELVYEFSAPTGVERMASCQVEVDLGAPLFVAVANALGAYIPLPLT
jgi:hypothetical protein